MNLTSNQIGLHENISSECVGCGALTADADYKKDEVDLYCDVRMALDEAAHTDPAGNISKEAIARLRGTVEVIRKKMEEAGCPFQGREMDMRMKYPCKPLGDAAYFVDEGSKRVQEKTRERKDRTLTDGEMTDFGFPG